MNVLHGCPDCSSTMAGSRRRSSASLCSRRRLRRPRRACRSAAGGVLLFGCSACSSQRGREGAPLTAGGATLLAVASLRAGRVTFVARGRVSETAATHRHSIVENVASRFKAAADKPLNFTLKGITMKTKLFVSAIAV